MNILFIFIVLFIIFIIFQNLSKFTNTNEKNTKVMIFHAPWCGHCVRAMPEFKKAKADKRVNIELIDTDDPGNKPLVKQYGVNGFPTIMKEDGTKHTGLRTADEIVKFALS